MASVPCSQALERAWLISMSPFSRFLLSFI
jgi:hypothetical protein